MMNKKQTKRALLSSLLALVLCFTMLLGTTFAWFTDSVSSTGNKIQSGTLKLKLEEKTATGENGWTDITESTAPLFKSTLWEPGYTDYTVLRLTNDGTLALKWQAELVHNGTMNELAEVIDVYVTEFTGTTAELPADAAAAMQWTPKGTLKEFIEAFEDVTNGELTAGEIAYIGIALHMQEGAGNEYQDKDLGDFDIHIVAAQNTVEKDGFNNDLYDENATYPAIP